MSNLKKQEQAAIEAVARRFSTTWETGGDTADALIRVAGKKVAVDVAALKWGDIGQGSTAKPRLRFDKVATRVIGRLEGTLGEIVPDGMTVLLTVTAPIRLPSKTAAALEEKLQTPFGKGSRSRDAHETIHGNRVRIRTLRGGSARAPKMIGFVHHPDSDPLPLLNMTSELLELMGGRRTAGVAGNRWLVLTGAGGTSWLQAWRYICSRLSMASRFQKVLMAFGDGDVEVLIE